MSELINPSLPAILALADIAAQVAANNKGVALLCDLVDRFEVEGRKIVVLAAPGDRRDEDIRDIAEIAAGHFDHYICRRDDNPRGREPDEIPVMLKDKLLESGIHSDAIEVIADEQDQRVPSAARDCLLALRDQLELAKRQITWLRSESDVFLIDPLEAGGIDAISGFLAQSL